MTTGTRLPINLGGGYVVIGQDCDANGQPIFPPIGLSTNRLDKIQQALLAACQLMHLSSSTKTTGSRASHGVWLILRQKSASYLARYRLRIWAFVGRAAHRGGSKEWLRQRGAHLAL